MPCNRLRATDPAAVSGRSNIRKAACPCGQVRPFQALKYNGCPQGLRQRNRLSGIGRDRRFCPKAAFGIPSNIVDTAQQLAQQAEALGNTVALSSPEPIQVVLLQLGKDIQGVLTQNPTTRGVARLVAIYYMFFTQPSPAFGIMDFYVFNPVNSAIRKNFKVADLTLRERLGGGNYGQVFEGVRNMKGVRVSPSKELTKSEKKRRVVLKRVNTDNLGIRSDFLRTGTMAQGAQETGLAEGYMCSRIMRDPLARQSAAEYLGNFQADATDGGFTKGTQWLVWKFESDSTLQTVSSGQYGEFPDCVEGIVLGKETDNAGEEKRRAAIVRVIMRKLLNGLKRVHSLGLVHRDVKPENVLITSSGEVKIIDFGAAVDLCTGINFNPLVGMLDPRYSPPEELVMPRSFPRAPLPFLSALLAPIAWLYGRPDLFDSYSAGVMLLQLSVPELRSTQATRVFNVDLARVDYSLEQWRKEYGSRYNFRLLDRRRKAGWDLACKLVCKRNRFNRGRLSVSQALRHRYFIPEF